MLSSWASFAGIALIFLMVASVGAAAPSGLQVGQPFPLLTLPALADGQPRSLADFRGGKVILHIWASW
ncbi:MAG: hypothetical protein IIB42_06055 [Candidatus Marinimicrobia bacterium]|nr:hypothetical protein [Candidatus Neomarinimicrobiota bacterium]MCH7859693.1 hypothetical protein [Candidatus Neomarinimicrobiota bacterium]